jgi:hypothetical protein
MLTESFLGPSFNMFPQMCWFCHSMSIFCLCAALRICKMTHSEIIGPWIPDEVVSGMHVFL